MKHRRWHFAALVTLLVFVGCNKDGAEKKTEKNADPDIVHLKLRELKNAIESDDVLPAQLLVEISELIAPGSVVDIYSVKENRIILSKLTVTQVRWNISGPGASLKFPASGFIGVNLRNSQMKKIRDAGDISVRLSK